MTDTDNAPAPELLALATYRSGLVAALVLSLPLKAWEQAAARPGLDPAVKACLDAAIAMHRALCRIEPLWTLIPPTVEKPS